MPALDAIRLADIARRINALAVSPEHKEHYGNFLILQTYIAYLNAGIFKYLNVDKVSSYLVALSNEFENTKEYVESNSALLEEPAKKIVAEIQKDFLFLNEQDILVKSFGDIASRIGKSSEYLESLNNEIHSKFSDLGLSAYGKMYEGEAAESNKKCTILLRASVFLSIALLACVFVFYNQGTCITNAEYLKFIYVMSSKLLIVGVLLFFIVTCINMYRLERNNELLNKHKGMVTKTYNVFMNSAFKDEPRDALLQAAAQSLFSFQPTGFTHEQTSDLSQIERAVKIAQSLTPKSSTNAPQ